MGIFGHHATFKGGKVLPGKKHLSRDAAIEIPPLPGTVVIPLWQHAGTPAQACVAPGRRVRTGERIGKPDGAVSAAIHASISGTVTAIREIALPGGKRSPAVVIESDGRHERAFLPPLPDWIESASSVLLDRIDEAGIVGLGGVFSGQTVATGKRPTSFINGAECEPTDRRLPDHDRARTRQ
jgi:electron transport complex protein RnfC